MSSLNSGKEKHDIQSDISQTERLMMKGKAPALETAIVASKEEEAKAVLGLTDQTKSIKDKYGENSNKLVEFIISGNLGLNAELLGKDNNLLNFFVSLENEGLLADIIGESDLNGPTVKHFLLEKIHAFYDKKASSIERKSFDKEKDISNEQVTENIEKSKEDVIEIKKLEASTKQVKEEVLSGVDQREFELKRLELEAEVKRNATVKASGLGQAELETISRAQAVNHFLGTANIPQDKADIVAKFRGDYQNVSAKYGLESPLSRMGKQSFENYSATLANGEKTKKQLDSFVAQNKDSINVDKISSVSPEVKQSIVTEQISSTELKTKEDETISKIFSDLPNQNDEVRKIIGDKKLEDLSSDDKKSILTASGFYDKFYEELSTGFKDKIQTHLAYKAVDSRGKFIQNNIEQLKIAGGYVENHDFENGNPSFNLRANIRGIDSNQHFSFNSDGLHVKDEVIDGNVSKSTDIRLGDIPSTDDYMKALSDIDFSKLSGKTDEERMRSLDELAQSKLAELQIPKIQPDVINNFVNMHSAKKGGAEFFVPKEDLARLFEGGEISKDKNPVAFGFYQILSNTFNKAVPSDISFLSNPNTKFLFTETVIQAEKNSTNPLSLLRDLNVTKIGPDNNEILDIEKFQKITQDLKTFKPEYAQQNLEKTLGLKLSDIGYKLVKGQSNDPECLGYYMEKIA